MAMRHAKKVFITGGIYHVFNRGVNRGRIFFGAEDYRTFLSLLNKYLLGEDHMYKRYCGRVGLLVFCLMANHFHLLLKQYDKYAMSEFMHSLIISYTMRINRKYERVGHLFQGVYKARVIKDDVDLVSTSGYIHSNPADEGKSLFSYKYSSLQTYMGEKGFGFVDPTSVLEYFGGSAKRYKEYMKGCERFTD